MIRQRVVARLNEIGVRFAVIGAVAVAARGAPRSTLDFDLFTTDRRVLQEAIWDGLRDSGVIVDVRKGDFDDPLAGVVRIGSKPEQIDIVVGRRKWEERVIERAEAVEIADLSLRVPRTSDLLLLKLAAGGPIDQQDIIRLLAVGPRDSLVAEVNEKIEDLPPEAKSLWEKIVAETA